jgi:hypothetical protein
MKKLLTLAAILAAFAFAQAPAFAADVAPAKTAEAKTVAKKGARLTKEEYAECHTQAKAEKDGKAPSKKEEATAFSACVKSKKDAKKGEAAPMKDGAPKAEENK